MKKSVKELQKEILPLIEKYNKLDINELSPNEKNAINKLQKIVGKGRGTLLSVNVKRSKSVLVRELRELKYVDNLGLGTEIGQIFLEDKYQKSYNTLLETFPDLTEEEYRQVVESFGAVGEEVVQQFDSNTIIDLVQGKGKDINLTKLMVETLRESKGRGFRQEQLTDLLMDKIREEIQ